MNTIDKLLEELQRSCAKSDLSREELKSSIKKVLLWINEPSNNTDANCHMIDHFIASDIVSSKNWDNLPADLQDILFDMGGTLHDTYDDAVIAENFKSTPQQLLDRLNRLPF